MVWYIVIAVIVGLIVAAAMVPKIIRDTTYRAVEFSDFLFACVVGLLIGAVVGFFWIVAVPLGALFYGLWVFYKSVTGTATSKKNHTGLRALFKW